MHALWGGGNSSCICCRDGAKAEAQFPDWGDNDVYGIGFDVPARPAASAGGPVRQRYAIVGFISQQGTKNLVAGLKHGCLYSLYGVENELRVCNSRKQFGF
jgi:hypothetical protein